MILPSTLASNGALSVKFCSAKRVPCVLSTPPLAFKINAPAFAATTTPCWLASLLTSKFNVPWLLMLPDWLSRV